MGCCCNVSLDVELADLECQPYEKQGKILAKMITVDKATKPDEWRIVGSGARNGQEN